MTTELRDLTSLEEDTPVEDYFLVDVEGYEGPLHLLLDLARRQKVDLLHVSVLELATQYLDFIQEAQTRRMDLAADYLLMAAWLAYLKSRLLLPDADKQAEGPDQAEQDAGRLAFRLKRLQAMRDAGQALLQGTLVGRDVFIRGAPQSATRIRTAEYDTSLWHLTQAFGALRQKKISEAPHEISRQFVLPLENARDELRHLSQKLTQWASLEDIRDRIVSAEDKAVPPRSVLASIFSAALELARDGDIDVRQDRHFAPLLVRGKAA